ncbi:MAG: alpha/beta hydrolase [Jejuia sp.]
MKMKFLTILFFTIFIEFGFSQMEEIVLWEDFMPNAKQSDEREIIDKLDIIKISKVQTPTLKPFLVPERMATGKAVIICPGGGYGMLAYDWEGTEIAKWFNARGISAFVLKYRLPNSKSILKRYEAPLQDAQRAIRIIRCNAKKWAINKEQIGVIGFSAGGHLAATLGTQFDYEIYEKDNKIDLESAKPNFMMLIYPVISMQFPITHQGSRLNLLGDNPNQALIDQFSNELHVNSNTPKTFIVHSTDDKAVPVENSLAFYKALKKADVEVEMHIYAKGGHGYGLATGTPHLSTWTDRLAQWLNNF